MYLLPLAMHQASCLKLAMLFQLLLHQKIPSWSKQTPVACHQVAPACSTAAQPETCIYVWQHTMAAQLMTSCKGWQTHQSGRWLCGRLPPKVPGSPREMQLTTTCKLPRSGKGRSASLSASHKLQVSCSFIQPGRYALGCDTLQVACAWYHCTTLARGRLGLSSGTHGSHL